uniref:Fascin actin-bundling protein 2, retinal n=1 Tax=Nomascus leucogenys TaxID=61853 RepID=A0A2I3G3D8_NOMLE
MPTNGLHQVLKIQFGLVNDTGRYLTAESFGFKVNASAPSLKRKQTWVLEPDPGQGTAVLLRSSHLGRYLSAEEDGRVACEAEQPGRDCRFLVLPQPDGRWVLQSEPHGRFFGGTEDQLSCFATAVSPAELWSANTMFEMEWRGRRVALKASNGRYVCMKKNGQLAAISDFAGAPPRLAWTGKVAGGAAQQTLSPPGKDEEFTLKLINRPILVLRGLDGFVCHHRGSNQLDTNRSVYDVFHLSFSDGAYQIRGRDGGFWYTGSHGSVCSD